MRKRVLVLLLLWPAVAWAQQPSASAPAPSASPSASAEPSASAAASASAAPSASASAEAEPEPSCIELVPEGAVRPEMEERIEPALLTSGHAAYLVVKVRHGAGETLLPNGFVLTGGGDTVAALRAARWFLPDARGAPAIVEGATEEQRKASTLVDSTARIPFVPLPKEGGRHAMTLPSIPISVARANGQLMTLCTHPKQLIVEDPIADEVDPKVRPNAPPRPQLEEWQGLATTARLVALIVPLAVALALAGLWWLRRPKPVPEKPQIPPWITAIQELEALRRLDLLEKQMFDEYFDRVDHITRRYLGDRYGFDGLESTSHEIEQKLARVYPPLHEPDRIQRFLTDTDFIKYARVTPASEDCIEAIDRAEAIVRATTPRPVVTEVDAEPKKPRRRKKGKAA